MFEGERRGEVLEAIVLGLGGGCGYGGRGCGGGEIVCKRCKGVLGGGVRGYRTWIKQGVGGGKRGLLGVR